MADDMGLPVQFYSHNDRAALQAAALKAQQQQQAAGPGDRSSDRVVANPFMDRLSLPGASM